MGSGGSGRPLSDSEEQLIQSQVNEAFHQTEFNNQIRGLAPVLAAQARPEGGELRNLIASLVPNFRQLGNTAQQEGLARRDSLEGLLGNLFSQSGALTGTAQNRLLSPLQRVTTSAINNIGTRPIAANQNLLSIANDLQGQFGNISSEMAGIQGTAPNFNTIINRGLGGSTAMPVNQQIGMLLGLGNQASQIGAAPGAAESALTPLAIQNLQQATSGEVPTAIQNLFSGPESVARTTLENQFDAARQRLIDSGVRGGALTRALAGLEGQRALGISQQAENRQNREVDAALGLLGQGTTFGLTQPFQRQQLGLQGLQTAGDITNAAGGLGLGQGQLRQGFLDIAGRGVQGLSQEGVALQGLSNQLLGLGTDALGLQGGITNQNIQNQLAQGELRNQALQIAGGLGTNLGNLGLGGASLATDALTRQLGLRFDIANQLGAGADELAFGTSPALNTQAVQLQNLLAQSFGIPLDILRGGGGSGIISPDLSGALAAASSAANQPGQPGALAGGLTGALSGAGIGSGIFAALPAALATGPVGAGVIGGGALLGGLAGVLG